MRTNFVFVVLDGLSFLFGALLMKSNTRDHERVKMFFLDIFIFFGIDFLEFGKVSVGQSPPPIFETALPCRMTP
jgi:hypothetical protein